MAKKKQILCVSIHEAKPNKMFTEEQRQTIRFLIYNHRIPCAECGKKLKKMWTMLCQFKAHTMDSIAFKDSNKSHMPLTPVCDDHPIGPDLED